MASIPDGRTDHSAPGTEYPSLPPPTVQELQSVSLYSQWKEFYTTVKKHGGQAGHVSISRQQNRRLLVMDWEAPHYLTRLVTIILMDKKTISASCSLSFFFVVICHQSAKRVSTHGPSVSTAGMPTSGIC